MTEQTFYEKLLFEKKLSRKHHGLDISTRLANLSNDDVERLTLFCFSGLKVGKALLKTLFDLSDTPFIVENELEDWILQCVRFDLIKFDKFEVPSNNGDDLLFSPDDDLNEHFKQNIGHEKVKDFLLITDQFLFLQLTEIALLTEIELPKKDDERRRFFLEPWGLLDYLAHMPELGIFHDSITNIALNWQQILFELGQIRESSNVINMICFTLHRRGEGVLAKTLLLRVIDTTVGLQQLAAKVNLGSLYSKDHDFDIALKLYRESVFGFIRHGAIAQFLSTLAEMATIYQMKGNHFNAAILLEICVPLHGMIQERKSKAIALSKLAGVYRQLRMPKLALKKTKKACAIFRDQGDYLNLGKTLLTQGNALFNLRDWDNAAETYQEALRISQIVSDPTTIAGALSGLARVKLGRFDTDGVKDLLDEAISIRKRNMSPSISVEYENMGRYYEYLENYQTALVWYKKALESAQRYMPNIVPLCHENIRRVENRLKQQRNRSNFKRIL